MAVLSKERSKASVKPLEGSPKKRIYVVLVRIDLDDNEIDDLHHSCLEDPESS